jgi:hypothetical protein
MVRSLRRKPDVSIVLPRIPEGVQTTPTLMGCVVKLKYSGHDMADDGKFLDFSQQVYLDSIGTCPFGDPISQPNPWTDVLANTWILFTFLAWEVLHMFCLVCGCYLMLTLLGT